MLEHFNVGLGAVYGPSFLYMLLDSVRGTVVNAFEGSYYKCKPLTL
jgi:hypothetical protein